MNAREELLAHGGERLNATIAKQAAEIERLEKELSERNATLNVKTAVAKRFRRQRDEAWISLVRECGNRDEARSAYAEARRDLHYYQERAQSLERYANKINNSTHDLIERLKREALAEESKGE